MSINWTYDAGGNEVHRTPTKFDTVDWQCEVASEYMCVRLQVRFMGWPRVVGSIQRKVSGLFCGRALLFIELFSEEISHYIEPTNGSTIIEFFSHEYGRKWTHRQLGISFDYARVCKIIHTHNHIHTHTHKISDTHAPSRTCTHSLHAYTHTPHFSLLWV